MKTKKSISLVGGLIFLSGCAVYAPPYPGYGAPAYPYGMPPVSAPYSGYGYGVGPIVPVPVFGYGGWGFRGRFHR